MRDFDWQGLWVPELPPWEVAFRAAAVYVGIQLMLRLAGRKELARYSTFDIVVLFLLTTAARRTIVGDDSSLTSAFVGLATLIGLDWLISTLVTRWPRAGDVIAGPVRRLICDGEIDEKQLRRARLSRDELLAQLRGHGSDDLSKVKDAYLERSGRVSFILWEKAKQQGG